MDKAMQAAFPNAMKGPVPYLGMGGSAGEAAAFYTRAFNATQVGAYELDGHPGKYMHIQVVINGGALMMTDHNDEGDMSGCRVKGAHLQLVVDDGPAWFDRAVAAGCTVVEPFARQFWGDDWGAVRDPFGVMWGILQPPPSED